MKTKQIKSSPSKTKFFLILTALAIALVAIPVTASAQANQTPYVAVDEMPAFPGGDAAMMKFIGSNLEYPATAAENNIQGKVIIRFCVTAEGDINQISILKGVESSIDKEAIRVVTKLPNFKPGKKDGVAVPVWYMVPITFKLATK
jgi:periplasmic protein TonB